MSALVEMRFCKLFSLAKIIIMNAFDFQLKLLLTVCTVPEA